MLAAHCLETLHDPAWCGAQIAFPLESDIKLMDPTASAEACKAADSAANIALVRATLDCRPLLHICSAQQTA